MVSYQQFSGYVAVDAKKQKALVLEAESNPASKSLVIWLNGEFAFFYYEVDGSSLCLQCDMIVHVGGKRTHERYLVLRQRIEFPGDKPGHMEDPTENRRGENQQLGLMMEENQQNHRVPKSATNANADGHANTKTNMMDLNMLPYQIHEQASNNQVRLSPLFIYQKQILNFVLI
ncbi:unnamed protein product [Camellia sinensis]